MFDSRSNRTIVKRIKTKYILVCNGMLRIEKTRIKKDVYHKILHSGILEGKRGENMKINKIFDDPEIILELKGLKKINLLLFLMFTKRIEVSDLTSPGKYMLSAEQREIFDLVSANTKFLDQIFKEYPKTFIKVCDYLLLEKTTTKNYVAQLLDKHDRQQLINKKKSLESLLDNKSCNMINRVPNNIHMDFCRKNHKNAGLLTAFKNNYETFIRNILLDQHSNILFENKVFYPELMLYNDLILSNYEYGFVDLQLFQSSFTTLNERGVRDYMKRKLEESQNE